MRATTRTVAGRTPRPVTPLKPLCAAFLLALGLGTSPIAGAILAPNVSDTFFFPALGAQQPNNAQLGYLQVSPGSVALVKFDMTVLPANVKPADIERATVILSTLDSAVHGGIDVHVVLNPSRWGEESGVGYVVTGSPIGRHLCRAEEGHEHFITIDVTEAVKYWVAHPEANLGLAFVSSALHPDTHVRLASEEYSRLGPVLDVQLYPGEGFIGAQGPAGDAGAMGPAGPMGPTGPAGAPGPKGDAGPMGPQGLKGDAGAQGPAGPVGPIGPQGLKGDTGAQGPVGPVGPMGPQGLKGDKGDTGAQGPMGPTGPAGPQGLQGEKGDMGAQGPMGPSGPAGPQGLKGDKGDTGAQGATGPAGPAGAAGPTGPAGPAGANGATGPQGPMGPMGPIGPMGPTGPTGSVVGGVYTVTQRYIDWETGNAGVFCTTGDKVIGGGSTLEGVPKNMHTSAPLLGNPQGWEAGYGSKATFTVYAICAK